MQGRVFAAMGKGILDGIRCDELGNVWSSSGDGVQVFSPAGQLIARVLLPEGAANLAFGGMTAGLCI
jgi:gluconolactonase